MTDTPVRASDVPMEAGPAAPPQWQSRIVDHGYEAPDQLLANPRNWRIHPKRQQDAVAEALDRVGWVQEVIVNRTTGHVVDGHLRVGMAISRDEDSIPVAYVELSEDEEKLVLATLDPLGTLAAPDDGTLKALLADLEGELDAELTNLMADLTRTTGSAAPLTPTQEEIDAEADRLEHRFENMDRGDYLTVTCPQCGEEFQINKSEMGAR